MKTYTKESLIQSLKDIRNQGWIPTGRKNNDGGVGNTLDDLFHKVGTKLHNCFFVRADSKRINGDLHFLYQDIFMLKALNKNNFIDAIERGEIYIDFDARTGHNHGTKFRLRNKALIKLYNDHSAVLTSKMK